MNAALENYSRLSEDKSHQFKKEIIARTINVDSRTFVVKIKMVKKPSDYSNLLNNTQMLIKFKSCEKKSHSAIPKYNSWPNIDVSQPSNVITFIKCGFFVI